MIIGAHVSIGSGLVFNAQNIGCETFQIYTKNQNRWKEKEYACQENEKFHIALAGSSKNKFLIASHGSYLVNLCAAESKKLQKSKKAFLNDSKRDLNSKVDRYEVIGEGYIGEYSFRQLMNGFLFQNHPGYLEVPGGDEVFKSCFAKLKKYRE